MVRPWTGALVGVALSACALTACTTDDGEEPTSSNTSCGGLSVGDLSDVVGRPFEVSQPTGEDPEVMCHSVSDVEEPLDIEWQTTRAEFPLDDAMTSLAMGLDVEKLTLEDGTPARRATGEVAGTPLSLVVFIRDKLEVRVQVRVRSTADGADAGKDDLAAITTALAQRLTEV